MDWSAECEQECTAELSADAENAMVGEVAVRVDAEGAADLWIGVNAPEGATWSLDAAGALETMLRTSTEDTEAWVLDPAIGHPVIELRDENWNVLALAPTANLLSQTQDTWQPLTVPMEAGDPWVQTQDPEFDIAAVIWAGVYINGVSDQPYTVWITGCPCLSRPPLSEGTRSDSPMNTTLMIHSSGLSSRQWGRLSEALPGSCVAPDLHGYPAGPRWDGGPALSLDLDYLVSTLDGIEGPVDVIGHSYGGSLALLLALERQSAFGG